MVQGITTRFALLIGLALCIASYAIGSSVMWHQFAAERVARGPSHPRLLDSPVTGGSQENPNAPGLVTQQAVQAVLLSALDSRITKIEAAYLIIDQNKRTLEEYEWSTRRMVELAEARNAGLMAGVYFLMALCGALGGWAAWLTFRRKLQEPVAQ